MSGGRWIFKVLGGFRGCVFCVSTMSFLWTYCIIFRALKSSFWAGARASIYGGGAVLLGKYVGGGRHADDMKTACIRR